MMLRNRYNNCTRANSLNPVDRSPKCWGRTPQVVPTNPVQIPDSSAGSGPCYSRLSRFFTHDVACPVAAESHPGPLVRAVIREPRK